jgi:hypothetical protein
METCELNCLLSVLYLNIQVHLPLWLRPWNSDCQYRKYSWFKVCNGILEYSKVCYLYSKILKRVLAAGAPSQTVLGEVTVPPDLVAG